MKNYPSHYLNSDMSPFDLIGKQMDFLYEQGRKIAIDYQDEEVELQVQREIEKDLFEPLTSEHIENCGGCAVCEL